MLENLAASYRYTIVDGRGLKVGFGQGSLEICSTSLVGVALYVGCLQSKHHGQ